MLKTIWLYSVGSGEPWKVLWWGVRPMGIERLIVYQGAEDSMLWHRQIPITAVHRPAEDNLLWHRDGRERSCGRELRSWLAWDPKPQQSCWGKKFWAGGCKAGALQGWGKALSRKTRKSLEEQLVETQATAARLQQMTCRSRFLSASRASLEQIFIQK